MLRSKYQFSIGANYQRNERGQLKPIAKLKKNVLASFK